MLETVSEELLAYQESLLKNYQEVNHKVKSGSLVFAGDSIIEFYPLKKYLGRERSIYNRGIAGIDSNWLLKNVDDHICDLNPEKVFILIGTNDIGLGSSNRDIIKNIVDMVASIKAESRETKIVLLSVLPVSDQEKFKGTVKVRTNEVIDQLNADIAAIPGIEFIDINSILKDSHNSLDEAYTKDGLHLNQKGYQKISESLALFIS
ncbi:SGNH/GDSL hydrolase family protein [Streptococcus catagoni]|uniref:SGNH/GDSL hydrolase family protein n=1 Tax=Streptococcus catagoni TaxID=2654874 RepID=UPI00140776A8|nr:SGNH/GDSL hydrolase family protein [Streptococcus catagoni]